MKVIIRKVWNFVRTNAIFLGIGSLIWLIIRSGTKPSRLRYPCQQIAASHSIFFLGSIVAPAVLRWVPILRFADKKFWFILFIICFVLVIGVTQDFSLSNYKNPIIFGFADFEIKERISKKPNPSEIFVVKNFPNPSGVYHTGLDSLLSSMAEQGTYFYKSTKPLPWCDSAGVIAKEDVVLIKVNAEWPERGMTNTDLLKGLIGRIVAHPDTFTGEVHLVENGQWRFSWAYSQNNAEDRNQTMQSVIDYFANQGYRVGGYNWTRIGYGGYNRWVQEYDQGDTTDGYIREDSTGMTYPKFTTSYGTHISVRKGIWNGASYDNTHLKFINVPVLKSHRLMGVTASVKHYIGFLSYAAIGSSTMHNRVVYDGLLGVELGKARFPDLNIVDATWVSAEINTGPDAPYGLCTRLNTILASKDPIALDYVAGKYILRPVSWWQGHSSLHDYDRMDPDNLNSENPGGNQPYSDGTICYGLPYNAFHQYLVSTHDELVSRGYQVTMDTTQMNIYILEFPPTEVDLIAPSNRTFMSSNTPTFDWDGISIAVKYWIQIDEDSTFASPVINDSTLTVSTYIPTTALDDGLYYWRVSFKENDSNWAAWSTIWSFTIDTHAPLFSGTTIWSDTAFQGPYLVTSIITDALSGVKTTQLWYRFGETGGFRPVFMDVTTPDTYTAQIPEVPDTNTMVYYFLLASDSTGNRSYDPEGAPSSKYNFIGLWVGIAEGANSSSPNAFALDQNCPNPFFSTTNIKFALPDKAQINIEIYDTSGRFVQTLINEKMNAGYHAVDWNPVHLSPGIYFYKIQVHTDLETHVDLGRCDYAETRKMILLR
jgi:hypothetical protein